MAQISKIKKHSHKKKNKRTKKVQEFWQNEDVASLLRVSEGFRLSDIDPDSRPGTKAAKGEGLAELQRSEPQLRDLQEKLYADSWGGSRERVLVVLQAMDAAGKGGIVEHVFGELSPYGLGLASFKGPTEEELAHDFLWRVAPMVPRPGVIGLFDRSHYEDVLIQRVHQFAPAEEIERRYGAIQNFEKDLADDGVHIVKIMLHISPEEQYARLSSRLDDPEKHWKYNESDTAERAYWNDHMEAFQIAIERTNAPYAPWYVVPANSKWYARVAVQRIVIQELQKLGLAWPSGNFDVAAERAKLDATNGLTWP